MPEPQNTQLNDLEPNVAVDPKKKNSNDSFTKRYGLSANKVNTKSSPDKLIQGELQYYKKEITKTDTVGFSQFWKTHSPYLPKLLYNYYITYTIFCPKTYYLKPFRDSFCSHIFLCFLSNMNLV